MRNRGFSVVELVVVALVFAILLGISVRFLSTSFKRSTHSDESVQCITEAAQLFTIFREDLEACFSRDIGSPTRVVESTIQATGNSVSFQTLNEDNLTQVVYRLENRSIIREKGGGKTYHCRNLVSSFTVTCQSLWLQTGGSPLILKHNGATPTSTTTGNQFVRTWINIDLSLKTDKLTGGKTSLHKEYQANFFPVRLNRLLHSHWYRTSSTP